MKYFKILSSLTVLGLAACYAPTQSNLDSGSSYAIREVAIIDVEKGITIPGQTVIVTGDRIDQIGDQKKIRIPRDAVIINGHGLYLMPGLVDAHVHYFDAPIFGRVLIANGVLLVRDMGMPSEYILKLRNELNQGGTLGPEMVAAGGMLDGDPPVIPATALSIRTTEEARSAVHQQVEAGADFIKVYSNLDKDVFLAILDEADKAGLKVVGHVPDSIYIEEAAAAGLKSSEHWFGFEKVIAKLLGEPVEFKYQGMGAETGYLLRLDEVDPAALQAVYERLHASGLTVTPTVVTFKNWPNVNSFEAGDVPGGEYISQDLLAMWKSQWAGQTEIPDPLWQNWAKMVKGLNQAGVPLMVGTDLMCPGVIPGDSVQEEMLIWQEVGIPTADILRSATIVPVEFMGLEDRLGSIREGKTASMVLVRGDPLQDIRNARQIEAVFLRGNYFSRQDLDRLIAEAKDLARHENP